MRIKLDTFHEYVEAKTEKGFNALGKWIARRPWTVIAVVLAVSVVFSCGLLYLKDNEVLDVVKLFGPEGTQAFDDAKHYDESFTNSTREVRILLKSLKPQQALTFDMMSCMAKLEAKVMAVYAKIDEKLVRYEDVCKKNCADRALCDCANYVTINNYQPTMMAYGMTPVQFINMMNSLKANETCVHPLCAISSNYFMGGVHKTQTGIVTGADALMTTFFLSVAEEEDMTEWEDKFLDDLQGQMDSVCPEIGEPLVYASQSLFNEARRGIANDVALVPYGVVATLIFLIVSLMNSCSLRSLKVTLPLCGLLCIVLSTASGIGLCMYVGLWYTAITVAIVFLSFGQGMANTVLICSTWDELDVVAPNLDIEAKSGAALSRSAMFMTMTTGTTVLAFITGVGSVFPALRSFCWVSAVVMFLSYVYTLTFFQAVMVLDAKRKKAGRMDLFCCIKFKEGGEETKKTKNKLIVGFSNILMNRYVKPVVIVAFVALAIFSLIYAVGLDVGISKKQVIPSDSYVVDMLDAQNDLFPTLGASTTVVIPHVAYYEKREIIQKLTNELRDLEWTAPEFYLNSVWQNFENLLDRKYGAASSVLPPEVWYLTLEGYLKVPYLAADTEALGRFSNDIVSNGHFNIEYSRFTYRHSVFGGPDDALEALREVQNVLEDYKEDLNGVFAHSTEYMFYEMSDFMWSSTIKSLVLSAACVAVCLLCYIHPWTVFLIIVVCAMLDCVLLAWIGWMGMELNPVTSVCLTVAIGFAVDYLSHVGQSFLTQQGNRQERAVLAVQEMFFPNVGGGVATLCGIFLLGFSQMDAVVIFFKMFAGIILFGILHGLVLLPVVLSYWGNDASKATSNVMKHQAQPERPRELDVVTLSPVETEKV